MTTAAAKKFLHLLQKFSLSRLALSSRWGSNCLISLYISILSGVLIALQYNVAEPFYSTASLELVVPFGSFWRGLHYYSSQTFFLFLLAHFIAVLVKDYPPVAPRLWTRLSLCLPIALALLFTGYVLRGDATGSAAGTIAEHLLLAVPIIGSPLNDIGFAVSRVGMSKVYVQHLVFLPLLGLFCAWPHLRRYSARWSDHLPTAVLSVALAVIIIAPLEPERQGARPILGPWFFIGLQELLRHIPPVLAGIVWPGSLLVTLPLLHRQNRFRKGALLFVLASLLLYCLLSVLGLSRAAN